MPDNRPADPGLIASRPAADRDRLSLADDIAGTALGIATSIDRTDSTGRNAVDRIRDAFNGHPRASTGGNATAEVWCFAHGRNVVKCFSDDEIDQIDCDPCITSSRSDPAGTAASENADYANRAEADLLQLDKLLRRIKACVDEAANIVSLYTVRVPTATMQEQTDGEDEPGCHLCWQVRDTKGRRIYSPPVTKNPTDVKGNLRMPIWICRWHHDFVTATGRTPSRDEDHRHRDGQKVRTQVAGKTVTIAA